MCGLFERMKKGRLKTGNLFSDDLGYHLFNKNLFRQFGLLVRHEFLSDIGQEVEVTLVLLEDVGDEFAAVHVLHVVAAAAVEEVGVGLVGDVVADVREVAVFDKLFGHFALDGFNAVHEVAQGLFVDGEFDGRLFAVKVGLDIDAQAVFVGQLFAQFAHGGQGGGFEEFEDVLFLRLVQHTLEPVLPVVAAPIDAGGGDGGRKVFVVGV